MRVWLSLRQTVNHAFAARAASSSKPGSRVGNLGGDGLIAIQESGDLLAELLSGGNP
jgi:hypothetical protein